MSQPSPAASITRTRCKLIRQLRAFFEGRDFIEVDPYIAITAPAPELHIDAVPVTFTVGGKADARFLQTSPELAMKRLLAESLPRLFSITPVFRDDDMSPQHRPEFRMLEWYRRDASWDTLFDDCEALMQHMTLNATHWDYQGRVYDMRPPWPRVRVDALFLQEVGVPLLEHSDVPSLRRALLAKGVFCSPEDTWDDLFNRAFVGLCEPVLAAMLQPVFLTHYPAPMAALAQLCPEDPRVAQRFELYIGGMELANAFGELTCATLQRQRFDAERQARALAKKRDYPLDERFFTALKGLPPSAGIALGVERLLMFLCDASSIDQVASIPWSNT